MMHSRLIKYIVVILYIIIFGSIKANAQFRENAFNQNYNEPGDSTALADSADQLFSFKELFGGLAHKNEMRIGTMFASSMILPGTSQIYNKQYWKLPIVYGSIGALAGTGGYYLHQYNKTQKAYDNFMAQKSAFENENGFEYPFTAPEINNQAKTTGTLLMLGAGLAYWGSLMDGVVNYHPDRNPQPGRSTIYSILLPGLGQIYNGELFKVPIYWGCLLGSVHFYLTNSINYERFRGIYMEATSDNNQSPISAETAKWYRDVYRRYRDYSVVAIVGFYLLQIIDANVFAYMQDFEVSDEITMNISPAVIAPNSAYAINAPATTHGGQATVGLRLGFRF
jgi:hypothetical protein